MPVRSRDTWSCFLGISYSHYEKLMHNIPAEDIEKWRARLGSVAPSVVLREIAAAYEVNRSALGFMLTDLFRKVKTPSVQAVWGWDINRAGRGLTDKDLDEFLAKMQL